MWTYEGYWNAVMGPYRTAADVVREFEIRSVRGLDEWLGVAEYEAWVVAGSFQEEAPEEWGAFHAQALRELKRAVQVHHDAQ